MANGIGMLDHKETKDVLAFLWLLDNPYGDISFKRIIDVPSKRTGRWIRPESLQGIRGSPYGVP